MTVFHDIDTKYVWGERGQQSVLRLQVQQVSQGGNAGGAAAGGMKHMGW